MNVWIIEDEALIARSLEKVLREIDNTIQVAVVLDSVVSAVQYFKNNLHPDLVFMDIQLSDGVSFDIFNQVKIECPIIFTTAYNEYAIRAFKVNSVDYLLKPIDKNDLINALEKFRKFYATKDNSLQNLNSLAKDYFLPNKVKFKERFLVHFKNGLIPITSDKVAYFLKDQIIYLFTHDGQKYITDYSTIDEIEELVNPAVFFRANRQTLLQIAAVDSYHKHATGKLEVSVKGNSLLPLEVSREKAGDFKTWIEA
jgi:DNA-binding LytR/AlgR family response regulator